MRLSGDVVVVGGGNVAADVARTALRVTDGKITMLCLESRQEMPAAKDEIAEVEEEGITIMNGWGPKEVLSENGKVTAIVFKKCVSVFDGNHRFAPVYDENETITVPCSNILMAIGQPIRLPTRPMSLTFSSAVTSITARSSPLTPSQTARKAWSPSTVSCIPASP